MMNPNHARSAAFSAAPLALAIALATPAVYAEEPVIKAQKMVVNATRIEQELDQVARPVAVVERDQLEKAQPASVAEAVRDIPNVTVQGGPRSNLHTVNIRGLDENKILQTVDGARQVFESGHRPSYFLDPEWVKNLEVVKGPASSLWGSGAVGGVIAQTTIGANDLLQPQQTLGGYVKGAYNDNNSETNLSAALAGRAGSWDLLLAGYLRDSDDLELGNGEALENSGSDNQGLLAKGEWQIDNAQSLSLSYRQADADGEVPSNGTAEPNSTSNFTVSRDTQTQNAVVDYRINPQAEWLNAQINGYWNQVTVDESRLSDGRADSTELDVLGFSVNNTSQWDGLTLLYGIDGYQESFDAERSGSFRPTPPEATSDVWGAFVQAVVPFGGGWRTELGLRHDDFSTEADNLGIERSESDLSPSAALVWQANNVWQFTLRYDEAFRAPSAEELYTTGTHFCIFPGFCNTFVPNPDLNPEEAANTEFLVSAHWENLGGGDLRVNGSVFQNEVDQFIGQIITGPTFFPVMSAGTTTYINVDEAEITGFELSAEYQLNALRLSAGYGQTRGEDSTTGDDLTGIPADTFTASAEYGFLQQQLVAGISWTHAADQDRTDYPENTNNTVYEGYDVVDLYAQWRPQAVEGLELTLTANNIGDEYYRVAWSELYQPGTEAKLAVKYAF